MLVGADEVVTAGLGGGVRAVGFVGFALDKSGTSLAEGSVDLVGGDVKEAEAGLEFRGKGAIVVERFVEEAEGSDDVGEDELFGTGDGTVDVAFGGEVHDGIGMMKLKERSHELRVFDAALHEDVRGIVFDGSKVAEISGVGELV